MGLISGVSAQGVCYPRPTVGNLCVCVLVMAPTRRFPARVRAGCSQPLISSSAHCEHLRQPQGSAAVVALLTVLGGCVAQKLHKMFGAVPQLRLSHVALSQPQATGCDTISYVESTEVVSRVVVVSGSLYGSCTPPLHVAQPAKFRIAEHAALPYRRHYHSQHHAVAAVIVVTWSMLSSTHQHRCAWSELSIIQRVL